MNASTAFFMIFSGVIALFGLFGAGFGEGYLAFFGFALFLFGVAFAYGCVKRHFDRVDAEAAAGRH